MTSHINAEQEEPATVLPTTDNEFHVEEEVPSDLEEDAISDVEDAPSDEWDAYSGMTEEEAMKKWLSARYERGSKNPTMKEPLTAPWGLPISDADVEKLKTGFRPRNSDDKWEMLVEDPDESGNISLHIIRSWLQEAYYILHIVPKLSNDDGGSAKIQGITWEGHKPAGLQYDAEQAKKEAVIMSRIVLHCEFETLPHYPLSVYGASSAHKKLDKE